MAKRDYPLEKDVTRRIIARLKEYGWFYKNYSGYGLGEAGIPDVIGHINGIFIAIEVKSVKGKLSKLQAQTIKEIKEGGLAYVIYGDEDFISQLPTILKEAEYVRRQSVE